MRLTIFAAALLAGAVPAPSFAQATLEIPAKAGWKHAATGLIFRPTLAGLPRTDIKDSGASELDMSIGYGDSSATLTIFVFRPSMGGAPMWFDRAETQIFKGDMFGGVTPTGAPRAFAPPRGAALSGLRRAYTPAKREITGTALAVAPLRDWLVAFRITSSSLDPAALEARLDQAIAGISWPDGVADAPPAAPIPACAGSLAFSSKAKLKKPDMADALIGATLMSMATENGGESSESKPLDWCRDGEPGREFAVYRGKTSTDSYTMALGDAGLVISVSPGLALDGKDAGYMLTLQTLDRSLVYPSFDKLPAPDLAYRTVLRTKPVSSASRGGKEVTIGMPSN